MGYNNLIDVQKHFPDETVCKEHLAQLRWNGETTCPFCDCKKVYKIKSGYKCSNPKCYKKFTVLVGTFFENTKIPLSKWFVAIYIATSHKKGISSLQLSKDISVTQKTAWFMLHRIREMLKNNSSKMLSGTIEVDETYIGGKNEFKHIDKKVKKSQGRASKDKTPVFGMLQRDGVVVSKPVDNVTKATLQGVINKSVRKGSTVISDEWGSYKGLEKRYNHRYIFHNLGEHAIGNVHTNTIEGFWSLLKRGIVGIYHSVSPKHLEKYCDEFSFRYNTKDYSEQDRFNKSISQCSGRLKYNQLIAQ
ncbi:MAG: IS1595 family transposase [Ignavibacteria bacterium]|nr:IS1595 family transposase [Ignavibacteria bacterium]